MRMRHKPYARPELEAWAYNENEPKTKIGRWRESFARPEQPLYIELGMGKGGFIAKMAHANKDINFLGVDIKSDVIVVGKRNIEAIYGDEPIDNVFTTEYNIEHIEEIISPEDGVGRVYVNFCNPWPKPKHKKHRLTHPRVLKKYAAFMKEGAELRFKTDDTELYEETLIYLADEGWSVAFKSDDFSKLPMPDNVETEHEKMFTEMGKSIKGIIAIPPKKV